MEGVRGRAIAMIFQVEVRRKRITGESRMRGKAVAVTDRPPRSIRGGAFVACKDFKTA